MMNQVHADSSPDLVIPLPATAIARQHHHFDDSALEGVAANVKLLLKLIEDHKEACENSKHDNRRTLRIATMLTIVDNLRDRIQTSQSFRSKPELRRCNTDIKLQSNPTNPEDKQSNNLILDDEKQRLKRELHASLSTCKSLQVMCSTLGREKVIMATELSKKVQELNGMEELVNDLKAHNENLMRKVTEIGSLFKKELKDKVISGVDRVRGLKERANDGPIDVREKVATLEGMFEELLTMIMRHEKKEGE